MALLAGSVTSADAAKAKPKVKVMTRNLYLGLNLRPGVDVSSLQELANFAGQAIHEERRNNFPVRAQGLADEILNKKPDLVGLQEASLYRDAPCSNNPIPPSATHVRPQGDYLKLLMHQLNRGKRRYRVLIKQPEFDFQTWANTDGDESTGSPFGCDTEIRLTYYDVILARRHAGVKTKNATTDHFDTLLQVRPSGVPIDVDRGWARVDAKVRGGPRFRFVTTHLEAFDDTGSNHTNQGTDVGNGRVRRAQAQELIAPGGPATGKRPVILVGDLNSDVQTQIKPGDGAANWWLLSHGFAERSTHDPLSCCLHGDVLRVGAGGNVSQFDHKVDHIMTDDPKHVGRTRTAVTGRRPHNGFWDSDHAGLFSTLKFR
jgi:hypothetical protein